MYSQVNFYFGSSFLDSLKTRISSASFESLCVTNANFVAFGIGSLVYPKLYNDDTSASEIERFKKLLVEYLRLNCSASSELNIYQHDIRRICEQLGEVSYLDVLAHCAELGPVTVVYLDSNQNKSEDSELTDFYKLLGDLKVKFKKLSMKIDFTNVTRKTDFIKIQDAISVNKFTDPCRKELAKIGITVNQASLFSFIENTFRKQSERGIIYDYKMSEQMVTLLAHNYMFDNEKTGG